MVTKDHGELESRLQNSSRFLSERTSGAARLLSPTEGAIPQPWQEAFGGNSLLCQAVIDGLTSIIAVVDESGTIRIVNQAWKRFAQANSEGKDAPGVGANYLQICQQAKGPASQEAVAALEGIEHVLQGKQNYFTLEYSCHSPTELRWFLMSVASLPQHLGAVISHEDITREVLAEEVLQQTESQWRQLVEANSKREEMLRLVSHELKTPITTSLFALHLLAERVSQTRDAQAASRLYTIQTQLTTLAQLIEDLLEKTSMDVGVFTVEPKPFAIDDMVRDTVDALGYTDQTHTVLIDQQAHCQVYADRQRSGQILLNLLTNALKYSPPDQPVRVKVTAEADQVIVSVQDQGVGIPKDQQDRIFEPFVRLSTAEQAQAPGLGLGLYIAAELVKRQEGHIWVESTSGKGSIFFFTLPRYPPHQSTFRKAGSRSSQP